MDSCIIWCVSLWGHWCAGRGFYTPGAGTGDSGSEEVDAVAFARIVNAQGWGHDIPWRMAQSGFSMVMVPGKVPGLAVLPPAVQIHAEFVPGAGA